MFAEAAVVYQIDYAGPRATRVAFEEGTTALLTAIRPQSKLSEDGEFSGYRYEWCFTGAPFDAMGILLQMAKNSASAGVAPLRVWSWSARSRPRSLAWWIDWEPVSGDFVTLND